MLTNTTFIDYRAGYQAQPDTFNTDRVVDKGELPSSDSSETNDTVNISSKARELKQEFQKKEDTLEQNFNSETQQLTREYLQEKNRLKKEFNQKRQSLDINIYA